MVPARPAPVGRLRLEQVKKRAVSTEFVTVLARLLTRHGNRVGALFYGGGVRHRDSHAQRSGGTCCTSCTRMLNRPELAKR